MTIPAIFWPGSGSFPGGITSLGYYDDDDAFLEEAPKVAAWCASRLGYPIMAVEMTDVQFYDCFVEAITEYSAQVNEFIMRDNMLSLQGISTGSDVTQKLITATPLPIIIELSEQYGTEAGAGGNVDWKKGYIDTIDGVQDYDLQQLWASVSESGNRIEIRRIFHERSPAISRGGFGFGDAGGTPSDGSNFLLGEFGWAGYDGGLNGMAGAGTAGQFLLMPLYDTLLRTQAIELNDTIRRSQYSFELINNKLKLMPVPAGERIYFQYLVKADRFASGIAGGPSGSFSGVASDYSNVPYSNMFYGNINGVGRRWILKYTLALCKETLGRILSKYEAIPAPNESQGIRLDGPILRQEAQQEKDILWGQLRETLLETGRQKQMEKAKDNEENSQAILRKAPLPFYIM